MVSSVARWKTYPRSDIVKMLLSLSVCLSGVESVC